MADAMTGDAAKPSKKRTASVSRTKRAGLRLPVSRVAGLMKKDNALAQRVGAAASVYLTAVLESILEEVIALASAECTKDKRKTITPHHLLLGVRKDADVRMLLGNVSIGEGGVVPSVPKRKRAAPKK